MTVRRVEPLAPATVGVGLLWQVPCRSHAGDRGAHRRQTAPRRGGQDGGADAGHAGGGPCCFNLPGGYAVAWRSAPLGLGALLWIPERLASRSSARSGWGSSRGSRARCSGRDGRGAWSGFPAVPLTALSGPLHALPEGCTARRWPCPARFWPGPLLKRRPVRPVRHRHGCRHRRQLPSAERPQGEAAVARPHCRWAVGALPGLVRFVAGAVRRRLARSRTSSCLGLPDLLIVVLFFLFPLSFAYAVLSHRILGVAVIVRTGRAVCAREGPRPLARAASWRDPGRGRAGSRRPAPHRDRAGARVGVRRRSQALRCWCTRSVTGWATRSTAGSSASTTTRAACCARWLRRPGGPGASSAPVRPWWPRIEAALHPEFASLAVPAARRGRVPLRRRRCRSGLAPPAIAMTIRVVVRLRATDRPLDVGTRDERRLLE